MTTDDLSFSGRIAVVTGAGSGIGLSVARRLHAEGATVYGFDLQEGGLAGVGTFIRCDVSDEDSVTAAIAELSSQTTGVDILVNNAGVGAVGTVLDATADEWEKVFGVNVFGTARVTRQLHPLLVSGQNPVIVNTCSFASTTGIPKRAVYSASKGALESLTKACAADFLDDGIRVNAVNPGTADTPWVQRLLAQTSDPEGERARLEARQPVGRLVTADEVANAIVYLADPRSGSTTGTVIAVDGGITGLRLPR
jgi:NAD(P)-dependent dehydrogenase (short-subunit alcohol dehydrogenase family)